MGDLSHWSEGRRTHPARIRARASAVALAVIIAMAASTTVYVPKLNAAESGHAIADFSGNWGRPMPEEGVSKWPLRVIFHPPVSGPGPVPFSPSAGEIRQGMPYIGDYSSPILLPHAAEAVRAQHDMYANGEAVWSAWSLCWPVGIPLAFSMVNAVQFLQSEDRVTIIYQRGQTIRHVYLNESHPPNIEPSWLGHSIGHYEGDDTLVIDTIAQDPRALTDRFATPKSEAMRVVERYTISADGQLLDLAFNVEDPRTFTTAWSAKIDYGRMRPRTGSGPQEPIFAQVICPENNRDAAGGTYPVPIAAMRDF